MILILFGCRAEVYAMFRALADRGVTHGDIRSVNVVQVSAEWPSLPCPVGRCAGRIFMWRIIDFETSQKHNKSIPMSDRSHTTGLDCEFHRPLRERFDIINGNAYRLTED